MPEPRLVKIAGSLYRDTKTGEVANYIQLKLKVDAEAKYRPATEDPNYRNLMQKLGPPANKNQNRQTGAGLGLGTGAGLAERALYTVTPPRSIPATVDPNYEALMRKLNGGDGSTYTYPDRQSSSNTQGGGAYPQPRTSTSPVTRGRTDTQQPVSLSFPQPNPTPDFVDYIPEANPDQYRSTYQPDMGLETYGQPQRQPISNAPQSELSVRSSLGRLPNTPEEIDAMYKSGQITRDQADQLELLMTNGPQGGLGQDQMGVQDGNIIGQQGNFWTNFPAVNFAGSDISTELFMLGTALGSKPGTRGRAMTGISAGGAAAFDITRSLLSGIGYQKRNQYVNDYYDEQQRRRQYNPVSQTANDNYLGGIPTGQMGGELQVNPRGQWDGPGNYRIPSNDITMQGVDFPVMAVPDNGQPIVMQPGEDYYFQGANYVDEYPMFQEGGTTPPPAPVESEIVTPANQESNPVWDATLEWLNKNPYMLNDKKPLSIDNMEQIKLDTYPKYENKMAYIPRAGYFNEKEIQQVEMPEDYKGLPIYLVNGKPVVFDRDFNKEFFQLYQEPKGKTRELYPVYGRGVSYRTQQFQDGGEFIKDSEGKDVFISPEQKYYEEQMYAQFNRIKNLQGSSGIANPTDSTISYLGGYYNDDEREMSLTRNSMDRNASTSFQDASGLRKSTAYSIARETADNLQEKAQGKDGYYGYQGKVYKKEAGKWYKQINGKYVPLTKGDLKQRYDVLNKQAKIFKTFQDGGVMGKNVGDEIEFEYEGKIYKGAIKEIKDGKLYI